LRPAGPRSENDAHGRVALQSRSTTHEGAPRKPSLRTWVNVRRSSRPKKQIPLRSRYVRWRRSPS